MRNLLYLLPPVALCACVGTGLFHSRCSEPCGLVPAPELAKAIPETNVCHGVEIVDNYAWLENAKSPETQEWSRKQNQRFIDFVDALPVTEYLKKEYARLWKYADRSTPTEVQDGKRLFFSKKSADQTKWVLYTKANAGAPEEMLIDPNTWDKDDSLSSTAKSRDGRYLAYGVAHAGDENCIIHIMDVETGEELPDRLLGWKQGVSCWKKDNSGFYYTCKPLAGTVPAGEEFYWHAVYFHKLGTSCEEDELVFNSTRPEDREKWHGVDLSDDEKYMLYYRGNFGSADIWLAKNEKGAEKVPVVTGKEANFDVCMVDDKIYVKTNLDHPNSIVYVASRENPGMENWQVFLPECSDNLEDLSFVDGLVYANYTHDVSNVIKIYTPEGAFVREMTLPASPCSASVDGYWHKGPVRLVCNSYLVPGTTYAYDARNDSLSVLKEFPVKYDLEGLVASQVWYQSKDGTKIPMVIVRHKDTPLDGKNPCILDAYGGFNVSIMPGFIGVTAIWCKNGGIFALANLRGGGEFGESWHKAGMRDKKQNVFDDFIAAAEYLIDKGYTDREHLGISGGSNGGLLVGACAMQRPDLYKAVRCGVPLLDMIKFHRFGIANIWSEEYGTSDTKEQFEYLIKYSPYHNIKAGTVYPAMLISGGENDARVDPMHVRKMGAKLQALGYGGPIFPVIYSDAGHGASVDFDSRVRQYARESAFMCEELGWKMPQE